VPNVPSVRRWTAQLRDANVRCNVRQTPVPPRAPLRLICIPGPILKHNWQVGGCAPLASWAARSHLSPHPGGSTRPAHSTQRIRAHPFPAATFAIYRHIRLISATSPLIYLLTVDKVCKLSSAGYHDPFRIVQRLLCARRGRGTS